MCAYNGRMRYTAVGLAALASGALAAPPRPAPLPEPTAIRARVGKSPLVITVTPRVAGAIHSLVWDGKEFVDSTDHGRQIQSASNFDCGAKFVPEVFNPTEAGSLADGAGPTSTSKLIESSARDNELMTLNRMAFWLKPGEKSDGHAARNAGPLSDHYVSKRVRIGYKDLPHAIEYRVAFVVPPGEKHTYAQFEAVTGYMPAEFGTFLRYDAKRKKLVPLSDGPGEQADPVVLSTASGDHAMGAYSPDQPSKGYEAAGYGRFRFATEKVVKWNCVFRVRAEPGKVVPGGAYAFRCFLVVGTAADCERALGALRAEFESR
jgi:hypothetical protein